METKKSAFLILIVLLFAAYCPVHQDGTIKLTNIRVVYAQNPVDTNQTANQTSTAYEVSLDIPCFKPTKIVFNYPYTNDHSVVDISTIGNSMYKHTSGPNSLEFLSDDVDTYAFTLVLNYANNTDRTSLQTTILIGLWSGTFTMQGITLTGRSNVFVIHVKLNVILQPTYPTEAEVAQEVVYQLQQTVVQQQEENRALMAELTRATTRHSIPSASAATISIVALLILGFMFRRRRQSAPE